MDTPPSAAEGCQGPEIALPMTRKNCWVYPSSLKVLWVFPQSGVWGVGRSPGRRSSSFVSFRPTTWDGVDINRPLGLRFTSLTPSPELGISDGGDIFKEFSNQPRTKGHNSAFWWPSAPDHRGKLGMWTEEFFPVIRVIELFYCRSFGAGRP